MGTVGLIFSLLKLLLELLAWIKERNQDPGKFIAELHQAVSQAKAAKTPEESYASVEKLQDLLTRGR